MHFTFKYKHTVFICIEYLYFFFIIQLHSWCFVHTTCSDKDRQCYLYHILIYLYSTGVYWHIRINHFAVISDWQIKEARLSVFTNFYISNDIRLYKKKIILQENMTANDKTKEVPDCVLVFQKCFIFYKII